MMTETCGARCPVSSPVDGFLVRRSSVVLTIRPASRPALQVPATSRSSFAALSLHPGHLAAKPLLEPGPRLEAQVPRRGRAVGVRVTGIAGQRRSIADAHRTARGMMQDRENAVDRYARPAAEVV